MSDSQEIHPSLSHQFSRLPYIDLPHEQKKVFFLIKH